MSFPNESVLRDRYQKQLQGLGKSKSAAALISETAIRNSSDTFVLKETDFPQDSSAYKELDDAQLVFENGNLLFEMAGCGDTEPEDEASETEKDLANYVKNGMKPKDKKKIQKKAIATDSEDELPESWRETYSERYLRIRESFNGKDFTFVEAYPEYAVASDSENKLYRMPLIGGEPVTESAQQIELNYFPKENPTPQPLVQEVPYSGVQVAEAFPYSFEITDIYPGYVVALKEGKPFSFNFTYSDGKIVFEGFGREIEKPEIPYSFEDVVEAYEGEGELTDIYPGYVIVKLGESRFGQDFSFENGKVVFSDEIYPVQAVLNTVTEIGNSKVLKESVQEASQTDSGKLRTLFLSEQLDLTESAVDRKQGIIDVTIIKPGWSLNGKYYSSDLLRNKADLWDGVKAYGNHPTMTEAKELPERSIWDQIGYYTNPRWEDGKVRATLKLVGDNEKKAHILDWAEEAVKTGKPLMGLSINALGKTSVGTAEGRRGVLVEDLSVGHSVDVVTTPSAGGGFDRLLASDDSFTNMLLQNLDYEEWREARPDFLKRLQKEMKTVRKEDMENSAVRESQQLRESLREREEELQAATDKVIQTEASLREVNEKFNTLKKEILVDQKLLESKLPEDWVSTLRPKLLKVQESDIESIILEEKKKYFGTKQPIQVTNIGAHSVIENLNEVAGTLGVGIVPLPFERPEEFQVRKERILASKRQGG